jgi:deazaflavin-dependent oxidoreductase (nitroreductase family)
MPNRILKALVRAGGAASVWLYRRTGGGIGGRGGGGVPVLLLTVAGRTTGVEHTVPIGFFPDGDDYLVVGSGGGSKAEPQWARNLTVARAARIQVGRDVLRVTAERLGPQEQAAVWRDVVVARAPSYAPLPRRSGRTIPVFRLSPEGSAG